MRTPTTLALAVLLSTATALAQPQERQQPLSLQEAAARALQHNAELHAAGLAPGLAAAGERQARAAFDPALEAHAGYGRDRTPTRFVPTGPDTEGWSGGASLTGLLPWGASYGFTYGSDRLEGAPPFSPSATAGAELSLRQPLLRGLGTGATRAGVRAARAGRLAAEAGFRGAGERTVLATVAAYWRLVAARDAADVARESLALAEALVARTGKQVDAGVRSGVDLTQARAGAALRREALLAAEAEVGDAEDALARLLAPGGQSDAFVTRLQPTERPQVVATPGTPAEHLAVARSKRPELEAARQAVTARTALLTRARSDALPGLDAVAAVGTGGLAAGWGRAHAQAVEEAGGQHHWSAGLVLSYPLGQRGARAARDAATLELERAATGLRAAELQVEQEVRAAVRALGVSAERVGAARAGVVLAREQLEAEERRLVGGVSTAFDVLRLQADLAEARRVEVRALADHGVAQAALEAARGTLLERFGLAPAR